MLWSRHTPFLRSCGYNPKKDIIFLPMSGLLGQNIKDPAPTSACPWYKVGAHSAGSFGCTSWLLFPVRHTSEMARTLCRSYMACSLLEGVEVWMPCKICRASTSAPLLMPATSDS